MMTDADSDLYTFDEDLGLRTRYFVLSGFRDKSEEKSIRRKIEELGGQNLYDVVWNDQITHVISKSFESTELVLAGKSVNLNTIYPSLTTVIIFINFMQVSQLEDGFSKRGS